MSRLAVAVISADNSGYSLYQMLAGLEDVEIVALVEKRADVPLMRQAGAGGILATTDLQALVSLPVLDVIVDTTGDPLVGEQLKQTFRDKALISGPAVSLLKAMFKDYQKLVQARQLQSELAAILDSVQEAIEVADRNGVIKYVNPAFTRITGIPESERVGQNIFDASPDGALATALRTGRSVTGFRTTVGGSNAEVISNAAPIMIDGQMEGVVVVFQHFTDIMKLMDELRQSSTIIENLSDKFGQVTTSKYSFVDILGTSAELRRCIQLAERAARSNSTVLLLGESGTGKELFAHAIHQASARRKGQFVRVNCAAIAPSLLESELFGYVEGSFTGARRGGHRGYFAEADGGTIFLDEVGDISSGVQVKLLRVLQEREIVRVGDSRPISVDVRVIAATNANLELLVRRGQFREDLYYRLNVLPIYIPPLRRRREDIPLLVNFLLRRLNQEYGRNVTGIADGAMRLLQSYDWPGNVRELENVLGRALINMKRGETTIQPVHLPPLGFGPEGAAAPSGEEEMPVPPGETLAALRERWESRVIRDALRQAGGNRTRAAHLLGISLRSLYNKMQRYGLM